MNCRKWFKSYKNHRIVVNDSNVVIAPNVLNNSNIVNGYNVVKCHKWSKSWIDSNKNLIC